MPPEEAAPQISTPGLATPAAEQPPAKKPLENFAARFQAKLAEMGGEDDESAETETAEAATPDKAETEQAKPEDDKVTVGERAEFREAKRRHEEWLRQQKAEIAKEREEFQGKHGERLTKAESILKAIENGDPEGFAQAVGTKDFNEFQESFIKRLADPNYKELREIQRKLQEKEQAEEERKKNEERSAADRQRAEAKMQYLKDLGAKATASKDKLAVAMADDPMFQNTVFAIQSKNWSETEQRTCSLEEALDKPLPGQTKTLREELKGLYERLGKAFGEPPALAAANGRKGPAPKTAVTPPRTTDAAGGNGKWKTQKEWIEYRNRRMAEAED